jgi:hypothetical protein
MRTPVLAFLTVSIALGADLRVAAGDELRTAFADYLTATARRRAPDSVAEASDSLESYLGPAEADTHAMPTGLVIPGVLKHFDLPDVARAIAPRPLRSF